MFEGVPHSETRSRGFLTWMSIAEMVGPHLSADQKIVGFTINSDGLELHLEPR